MWTIDTDRPSGRRRAARESQATDSDTNAEQVESAPAPDAVEPRLPESRGSARHTKQGSGQGLRPDTSSDPDLEPDPSRPAIHLPLSDPYQPPEGYPIKANTHSGLYYTPDCDLYDHTVPEVWFASEELAQANGFVKAE
jgi:uncharacterized protein with LGFP repeats